MVKPPTVSVLLPVRNGAAFLRAACDSVLAQQGVTLELLVVDDGSTDATPEILRALAEPRLRVIRQAGQGLTGQGLVAALNRGLAEARAPLVARLDADDLALPRRLALQAAHLAAHPRIVVLGSAWQVIDAAGRPHGVAHPPCDAAAVRDELGRRNCLAHPAVMFRRDAVLAAGGYRAAFEGAEDYDLWLRLSERHDLENLPQPLLAYREHPGQGTRQRLEQGILAEIGALAAWRRRRDGGEDGMTGAALIDRDALVALGLSRTAVSAAIVARALGSARRAHAAGDRAAAGRAAALVLAENPPHWKTRLHARLLLWRAAWR